MKQISESDIEKIIELHNSGLNNRDVSLQTGVSEPTVGKYIRLTGRKSNHWATYMPAEKLCKRCSTIKPAKDFEPSSTDGTGLQSYCRECRKKYGKQWYAQNKDKNRERSRRSRLKSKYGLTTQQYEEILANCNFACTICGATNRKLHLDHCHSTNKVRSILCSKCNQGLGFFEDNIDLLIKAIDYLNKHND